MSRVVTWYEGRLRPARRPGGAGGLAGANNALGNALRRTLKGLRKLHPSDPEKNRKVPVTRADMIGIKRQLDLSTKFGSMVWAFCCTCWQGGRRSGDVIRGKAVKKPWAPQRDMHRGRVVLERGDVRAYELVCIEIERTDRRSTYDWSPWGISMLFVSGYGITDVFSLTHFPLTHW